MAFKGAIFDIDGVIIDTAHVHHLSWREVFKDYGIDFTFRDFKTKIDAMPREKGLKKIVPHLSDEMIKKEAARKQKFFIKFLDEIDVTVFMSTVKLIKDLRKRGIKVAMASSSKNAAPILKKLGYFTLFHTDARGAYVKRGKPYPDLFLKAAKKLKVKPHECVVFEDAQKGIEAAINAGMKSIGVKRDKDNPLKNADLIVPDLKHVSYAKIKALFGR
jgi:beta-phosphoglucomutase